ncbi:MAG: hypothetical protein WD490_06210 [Opitutales bacterium]
MGSNSTHKLPPFSLVTASSEDNLTGCGKDRESEVKEFSGGRFSQHIPVGTNEISRISLLLEARTDVDQDIPARIFRCDYPRDLGSASFGNRPLLEGSLSWSGSGLRWIEWEVQLTTLCGIKVGSYIRVELDLPAGIGWARCRRPEAAFPGAVAKPDGRLALGSPAIPFCFRVSPPQACFWASNILPEGANRNRFTGMWRSDPSANFPQRLEISWRDPIFIKELLLDFPDSPECPSAYNIRISSLNGEKREVHVAENPDPHTVHDFHPPVAADHITIDLLTTHGSPSVSVHRIRLLWEA